MSDPSARPAASPHRLRPPRGPGATRRRTRSRPSRWPCGSAPPGSRATSGSPPTARRCSTTTAWSGGALRRRSIARSPAPSCPPTSRRSPSCTRPAAPTSTLSLDVKDPAAFDRRAWPWPAPPARRGRRAPLAVPPPTGSRWSTWRAPGRRRAPRRLDPAAAASRRAPSAGPPRWRHAGIDAVNLHHTDWTGGLTTLFHRFGVLRLRLGRPARRGCSTSCSTWASTASTATTSTAWSTPCADAYPVEAR